MEGRTWYTYLETPQWYKTKQNPPRKFYTHEGLCCEHNIYRVLHVQQTLARLTIAPTVCLDTYGELKIERIKNARPFINRYPNDLIDGRLRIYMLFIYICTLDRHDNNDDDNNCTSYLLSIYLLLNLTKRRVIYTRPDVSVRCTRTIIYHDNIINPIHTEIQYSSSKI